MKPYKFQSEGLDEIDDFGGRCLVAWDPGLGKTLVSLWWTVRHEDTALPAIVVCPASVKFHWEAEAQRLGMRTLVLEGRKPVKHGNARPHLIIINYDILIYRIKGLVQKGIKTVILDEIHFCGNQTKRTDAAFQLCRGVPHILALSGTPLVSRPMELYNGLKMVKPRLFPNRFQYGKKFCKGYIGNWGWDFSGASNTDKLHKILTRNLMSRKRKSEVLKDLPSKVRRVIHLPITNPKEYEYAKNDFIEWLSTKSLEKAVKAEKAERLVRVGYLLRLAARLKMKYVVDWINEMLAETDEKLVVFAVHKPCIQILKEKIKANCVVIDGSTPTNKRGGIVKRFQEDSETRVLIGNIRAAGMGLTLTAASNVVFVELPWTPGAVVQAEDRAHRLTQDRKVFIWYLISKGTIEEKLCAVLQEKQKVLSAVLDGGPVSGDLDVYSQLMKGFLKGNGR